MLKYQDLLLRAWLLAGLVFHKVVWEIMKLRKGGAPTRRGLSLKARLFSLVKVVILASLIVQIFVPDIFPISQNPAMLRASGAVLYTFGLLLAVTARIQLGMNWSDIEKSRVVEGHRLVARGLYRYVRHPIYTGDLILLAGFELALNSWAVLGVAAVALYVRKQAIGEERKLLSSLQGYEKYYQETSRFVPLFRKNNQLPELK
jgi:protein-S-isoprenylcysteine O-methyltransferase Ste14